MYHSFLIHSSADGHLSCFHPGYYKQCFNEHWGARVSFRYGFPGVFAQKCDYNIVISLQLIKINGKKKEGTALVHSTQR